MYVLNSVGKFCQIADSCDLYCCPPTSSKYQYYSFFNNHYYVSNEWTEFKIQDDSTTLFSVDKESGTTTIKKAVIEELNGETVVKPSELVALQQQLATALARIQALESKPTTSVMSIKNSGRNVRPIVTCTTGVVVNCLNRSQFVRELAVGSLTIDFFSAPKFIVD
jgi:hypothetical protein